MEKEDKVIRGYKGFDKDLKCRGFQYEIGKEYECEKAIICLEGFHFCERPLDVLEYYGPIENCVQNRFCEVEGSGDFDRSEKGDKLCCTKIKIIRELTLEELIGEGMKELGDDIVKISKLNQFTRFVSNNDVHSLAFNSFEHSVALNTGHCSMVGNLGIRSSALSTGNDSIASSSGPFGFAKNKGVRAMAITSSLYSVSDTVGDCSLSVSTGYGSLAANEGNMSVAISTGQDSQASTEGLDSVAIVTGANAKAKGKLGCWIVLTERDNQPEGKFLIKDIKGFKVDGEQIKPDTYYTLVDGKPVEVVENK